MFQTKGISSPGLRRGATAGLGLRAARGRNVQNHLDDGSVASKLVSEWGADIMQVDTIIKTKSTYKPWKGTHGPRGQCVKNLRFLSTRGAKRARAQKMGRHRDSAKAPVMRHLGSYLAEGPGVQPDDLTPVPHGLLDMRPP